MRCNYDDIFQSLSASQAGEVIRAIYAYVNGREVPLFADAATQIAFQCIQKDLVFDLDKYKKVCEKRKQSAQKRWTKKHAKKCKSIHNEDEDDDEDEEMRREENISTAQPTPAQGESASSLSSPKTTLHRFGAKVLEHFEPPLNATQQEIWFKRNARCLRDILRFCEENIPLALQTIDVCLARLQQAGLTGGYEAVCRNLPEYLEKARTQMRNSPYAA